MKISIVIPNYNGLSLLEKNLPKVFNAVDYFSEHEKKDVEIIIVDDASTDSSYNFLEQLQSQRKIILVTHKKNMGFSYTVNDGVRNAKGEFIVLLNSDVFPERNFLIQLLSNFTSEKIFAVGCMDRSIEDGKEVLRGRGIGEWRRGLFIHSAGKVDKNTTLWVSGGSGIFRKSVWDTLEGFNTIYSPFYWEDIDLSYRALKSGYEVLFDNKSIVTHEHDKGAILRNYNIFKINIISYRNQFLFIWMNITQNELLISHILWLPYHLFKALIRGDLALFYGFFSALLQLNNVVKWRSKSKKHFIKKDTQIFIKQ